MKKILFALLILFLFPNLSFAINPKCQDIQQLIRAKKAELSRVKKGERGVNGYAIYGYKCPPKVITGNQNIDQCFCGEARVKVLMDEISALNKVLNRLRPAYSNKGSFSSIEYGIDRMGHDYRNVDLKVNDPKRCMQICLSEPKCKAWTFVKPNTFQGPLPKCWLKDTVPPPSKNPNCVSGVKTKFPVRPGKNNFGCFRDDRARDLDGFFISSADMTHEKCISICRNKGFKYAGVQYGSQCFCGNSYGKYGKSNSCNMKCSGNANEICGGFWANLIFGTGQNPPRPSPNARRLGCFKDQGDPFGLRGRDLNGAAFPGWGANKGAPVTIEKCISFCNSRGFRYAGVQYGSQCFCGNSYGKYGRANNCNMKCNGNPNEICGGFWANDIYELRSSTSPGNSSKLRPKTRIHTGKNLGCFKDNPNRDLNGYFVSAPNMTQRKCITICGNKGFKYAGVQYGSQCFCGNSYGKYGRANNCIMRCSGNSRETCGGFWSNLVFEVH